MAASGDFVVPTYGGQPRIDKPPLFMWSGASVSGILGEVSEVSVRLPSALSAVLCLISTFIIGARLFGGATALLGAVILGTSGRFLLYSQWAATDMMLASLTTLALAFAVCGGSAPAGSHGRPRIDLAGILFLAACALAMLTKGPIGVVLPVGVVLADHLFASWREPRRLLETLRGLAVPWAAGVVAFAAIAVPWFVLLAGRLGPGVLREILLRQNVDRFVEAWNAQQPWYFYFEVLPMDFLPWSFFLPLAFVPVAEREEGKGPSWRFLRIWFVVVFAFFSAASGKSPEYLLPLLPAACIMVARVFIAAGGSVAAAARRPDPRRSVWGWRARLWIQVAGAILASVALGGAAMVPSLSREALPGAAPYFFVALVILAVGAGCLVVAARSAKFAAGAAVLAAAVILVRLTVVGPLMDAGNAVNLAPEVGRALQRLLPPDIEVGVGRKGADYVMYYASRPVTPLERPDRTVEFLFEREGRALVLKTREFRQLRSRLGGDVAVLGQWGDERRGFVLLRKLPATPPASPGPPTVEKSQ